MLVIYYIYYIYMFDIFLKYFGVVFAQRPPFYSLTKAVFEGSRDPPAQPG